jgi:hypothetical protein
MATEHWMVVLSRRELQGGGYIVVFQIRIVSQDLVACRASGEELENILHANAQAANARTATADIPIHGDSLGGAHIGILIRLSRRRTGPYGF